MFFSVLTPNPLRVFSLVFLFTILPCANVLAADQLPTAVQVFTEHIVVSEEGVLPQGITWDSPLKAGDLTLSRHKNPRYVKKSTAVQSPSLPVGELKAPRVPTMSSAVPPVVGLEKGSTASVMLLQGMKNALQQAGYNPEIPKSNIEPKDIRDNLPLSLLPKGYKGAERKSSTSPVFSINALVASQKEASASSQETSQNVISVDSEKPIFEDGLDFLPGREPKTLVPPQEDEESTASKAKEDYNIAFPPEMATKIPSPETAVQDFEEQSSIFGAPVAQQESASNQECIPQVIKWSRSCAEAGYPAEFSGNILGESRMECPSGEQRDVWLSNSCAEQVQENSIPTASEEASVVVLQPENDNLPLDASCGTANGLPSKEAPTANLCVRGKGTPVTGEGPWRWNCLGLNGGVTVSCAAPLARQRSDSSATQGDGDRQVNFPVAQDGVCGRANGLSAAQAPAADLCEKGLPSNVNGEGPWTWACSGLDGGQAMACHAPVIIKGQCGSASGEGVNTIPERDLCQTGFASAVTGEGPWNWTCSGVDGGEAALCQALPSLNAVCGSASMTGHRVVPDNHLCSAGEPSDVSGEGPWNWFCKGQQGGATVSCEAAVLEDGKCGTAHGGLFAEAPETELCEKGSSSRVTGLGPWNWTCTGNQGGTSESCTASLGNVEAIKSLVQCGEASQIIAFGKPTDKLCDKKFTPSEVLGEGPWTWTCSDDSDNSVSCSTLTAVDGDCGSAADSSSFSAPMNNLCKAGSPTEVKADQDAKTWTWNCSGFMSGSTASCVAPMTEKAKKRSREKTEIGRCGAAHNQGLTVAPEESLLCDAGKPSAVRGSGPWSWTCGDKICKAPLFINGACGTANGAIQRTSPKDNLCASGQATKVSGNGPWLWSCVGAGGGTSVSCSASSQAQIRVDGTCGVASNSVMDTAPTTDLCDTGTPSDVYGKGPWTWTCSGMNAGIATTCTTLKTMPKEFLSKGSRVDGLCGFSNGNDFLSTPNEGLCEAGIVSDMKGKGPWSWSCQGDNGGATVSCTAVLSQEKPLIGECGTAHHRATLVAPTDGLCASGVSSAISGKGPWTWSCSGKKGGYAVSCTAPKGVSKAASIPKAAPLKKVVKSSDLNIKESAPIKLTTTNNAIIIPNAELKMKTSKAPSKRPVLPKDGKPLVLPSARDDIVPLDNMKLSASEQEKKMFSNSKLNLSSEVSMISFVKGSDQLNEEASLILVKLAEMLKTNSKTRITLVAYSSVDDKLTPREARRISLNRALSIRKFLTDKGISHDRLDMRPMGGNVPSGDMDRVDIRVN